MNVAEIIRRLGAAGCTNEQIAVAIECFSEIGKERRAKAAAHMRDVRSRKLTLAHVTHAEPTYVRKKESKEERKQDSSEPKKVPRICAIALPTTWTLDEQDTDYARSKGWPPEKIKTEAERFKDHALDKGRTAKNWHAAWRNWVTSPYQQPHQAREKANGKPTVHEACDNLLAKLRSLDEPAPGGLRNGAGETVVRLVSSGGRERP